MARLKSEVLNLVLNVKGDKARKEINDTEKAIADAKARVKDYRKEMQLLAQQGQTNSARYKELSAAIKEENISISQNKKRLEELRSGLKLNDMTMRELSRRVNTLKREMDLLRPNSKEWKALNSELKTTSARMQQLKGSTSSAAAAISKAQTALGGVIAVVYGVARVFGGAFNTLKDFEQANVNLATILGRSTSDIAMLTSEAERLGRTTKYTASEVTGLQIELAKLGFNEGQILTMEESVLHFATAVGADERKFKAKYAERIAMYKDKYQSWFEKNFEFYKWRKLQARSESMEFVIGLLCLLYREKKIQFTIRFPSDGSIGLQREGLGENRQKMSIIFT